MGILRDGHEGWDKPWISKVLIDDINNEVIKRSPDNELLYIHLVMLDYKCNSHYLD